MPSTGAAWAILAMALLPRPPAQAVASVPGLTPAGSAPCGTLADLAARVATAKQAFDEAVDCPADRLDLMSATRDFDDVLCDVAWELDRVRDADVPPHDGSVLLLAESADSEIEVARLRLRDVERAASELIALARLETEMRAATAAGRPTESLRLFGARLPSGVDPLEWPSVLRKRLRKVESEVLAAETLLAEAGPQ